MDDMRGTGEAQHVDQADDDWQMIDTIPALRTVMVRSATGIECLAYARDPQIYWVNSPGRAKQKRVSCRRMDGLKRGDVSAVAWRAAD